MPRIGEPVRFMGTEMSFDEYSELLTEIRKIIEVFAAAREFSTDREGNIYIWGDFSDLEMRTLRKAIENLHPNAHVVFNPAESD